MTRREWAEQFKENHECHKCPFVINSVDVGVGTIYHCDHVCMMTVDEIVEEIKKTEETA